MPQVAFHRHVGRRLGARFAAGALIAAGYLFANSGAVAQVNAVGSGTAVSAGGAHAAVASSGVRASTAPVSSSVRSTAPRVTPVGNTANVGATAAAGGPTVVRVGRPAPVSGSVSPGYAAPGTVNTSAPLNAWTEGPPLVSDPQGAIAASRQGANHDRNGNNNYQQSGTYHRFRRSSPFLSRYYQGYYPVYVDVPVGGDYYDPSLDAGAGYNAGPADGGDGTAVPVTPPPPTILIAPQNNDAQPAPDGSAGTNAPAPNAAPADTAQSGPLSPRTSIGPDSLVEAVQEQLARRGYFHGKVDAMFHDDTKAALRAFQGDNYLAPTGLLNEPTVHALGLD